MPEQSKPTAVHFALIAFVMISLVLAMSTYIFHREARLNWAELVKAKKSEQEALTRLKQSLDELEALKARQQPDGESPLEK